MVGAVAGRCCTRLQVNAGFEPSGRRRYVRLCFVRLLRSIALGVTSTEVPRTSIGECYGGYVYLRLAVLPQHIAEKRSHLGNSPWMDGHPGYTQGKASETQIHHKTYSSLNSPQ